MSSIQNHIALIHKATRHIVFRLSCKAWNATEITSPSGLPYRPSSALQQQLYSPAMRLLSRLEYGRSCGASWSTYFIRIPCIKKHCMCVLIISNTKETASSSTVYSSFRMSVIMGRDTYRCLPEKLMLTLMVHRPCRI